MNIGYPRNKRGFPEWVKEEKRKEGERNRRRILEYVKTLYPNALTSSQIAHAIGLSRKTVWAHLKKLYTGRKVTKLHGKKWVWTGATDKVYNELNSVIHYLQEVIKKKRLVIVKGEIDEDMCVIFNIGAKTKLTPYSYNFPSHDLYKHFIQERIECMIKDNLKKKDLCEWIVTIWVIDRKLLKEKNS